MLGVTLTMIQCLAGDSNTRITPAAPPFLAILARFVMRIATSPHIIGFLPQLLRG